MFGLGVFAAEHRLEKLSKLGDSLVKLRRVIDWNMFRPILSKALELDKPKKKAGRPSFDSVLMFKVLILQRLYNLSDAQIEFQINDRMSFMRFLGLGVYDRVPDEKTVWAFREKLTKAGVMPELFERFAKELQRANLITREGSIVDASFVEAPRQRNTREENQQIKQGEVPEEWQKEENANKLRQKDVDARWTIKRKELHYGYKNSVKVDLVSKLITKAKVTAANEHDSQALESLIDENDRKLYADSAYDGKNTLKCVPDHVEIHITKKASRHVKLTEAQREENRVIARKRCRVEHVFGFMTTTMKSLNVRSIGLTRAKFSVMLSNLVYNMFRYEFLTRSLRIAG